MRWQAPGIRRTIPEPGEETLIVFTSQPYRGFVPARFARVVAAERDDEALRMQLELGSRARAADDAAFDRAVLAGPNPSEQSQVWILRTADETPSGTTKAQPRPPVEYADPSEDERAWRDTIDHLASDADYGAAVFLRIATVRAADEGDETGGPALPVPYRLTAERPYLVRVASHNPHLSGDALGQARLVPRYDELATAIALDALPGIPRDGMIDLLIEPIVGGPGWLELNVALGVDLLPAASLGWVAEARPIVAAGETDVEPAPATMPPAPLEYRFEAADPIVEAAVRAHAVAVESGMAAERRLELLRHLRAVAPAESRLAEAEAIALYELGRYAGVRSTLADVPLDSLGADGRATLLAATLRTSGLPDPLERVRMADLSRPNVFGLVLEASAALAPGDQVRLTEFVVRRLLADDRAAAWLRGVAARELPAPERARLAGLAQELDAREEDTR